MPAGIIKSVASIFIPKLVIDSLESFRSEYTFLINIIIVTVVIAVSSIVELLAKNTMEHNMNSFVLIQLNKLWLRKCQPWITKYLYQSLESSLRARRE